MLAHRHSFQATCLSDLFETLAGASLGILEAGERCTFTGEYFEKGSTSEVIGYQMLAGEFRRILQKISPVLNAHPEYQSGLYRYISQGPS